MPRLNSKTATAKKKPAAKEPTLDETVADEALNRPEADTDEGESKRPERQTPFAALDDADEFHCVVYWGLEGSGKTTHALTASNEGKVLVINAEGGVKAKALRKQGINTKNVVTWPNDGKPITHARLDRLFRHLQSEFEENPKAYFAVVFDSATEVTRLLVNSVSDNRVVTDAITDDFDKFFTDRSDYGTANKMFRGLLRKYRSLPCHLIFTALLRRDEDEDTKKVMYGPDVPPASQNDLAGQADIVLYTRAEDDRGPFRALAKRGGRHRVKDRYGVLPNVMAEPTFQRVLAYIDEDITPETDALQQALKTKNEKKEKNEDNDND